MLTIDDDMKETISEGGVDPNRLSIIEGAAFRAVRAMTRLQPPEKMKRSISPSGWDAPCRC
jgi:hypothetical protein